MQGPRADQVVGEDVQADYCTHFVGAVQFELAQTILLLLLRRRLRLDPAKQLLDVATRAVF